MMKMVITGGPGLVGSVLRKDLADWEIIVLTRNPDSFYGHGIAVKWEATKEQPVNELEPDAEPIDAPVQAPVDHGAVVQCFLNCFLEWICVASSFLPPTRGK